MKAKASGKRGGVDTEQSLTPAIPSIIGAVDSLPREERERIGRF